MEREVKNISRICQRLQGLVIRKYEHQRPWSVILAAGLMVFLTISTVSRQ
jgi:hypothetical protein